MYKLSKILLDNRGAACNRPSFLTNNPFRGYLYNSPLPSELGVHQQSPGLLKRKTGYLCNLDFNRRFRVVPDTL
jgi:hypothetical protein